MNKFSKEKSEQKFTKGNPPPKTIIIGIGASAGGLEALEKLLLKFTTTSLSPFSILIKMNYPTQKVDNLIELLGNYSSLEVMEAVDQLIIEPYKIYVFPYAAEISFYDNRLTLNKTSELNSPKTTLDDFFSSIAQAFKKRSLGIILSGSGSEGPFGLQDIKNQGGFTVVQEPQTAKYDAKPLAALQHCEVDAVLAPEEIGKKLAYFINYLNQTSVDLVEHIPLMQSSEKLISILENKVENNLTTLKTTVLNTRMVNRISQLGIGTIEEYYNLVENDPEEAFELLQTKTNPPIYFCSGEGELNAIQKCLDEIIQEKPAHSAFRVWVPGCSTGEEVYMLAILFYKLQQEENFSHDIQIFATDYNEAALVKAKEAIYSYDSIKQLPEAYRGSYFENKDDNYELIQPIKSMVWFSNHEFLKDPPFLKIDLISCKNLFSNLNKESQNKASSIFYNSLNPQSYLLLGKTETVAQYRELFRTIDTKHKLFQRNRGILLTSNTLPSFNQAKQKNLKTIAKEHAENDLSLAERARETLLSTFEYPYIVIDEHYHIYEICGDVRPFLSLAPGSYQNNILNNINKELKYELYKLINECFQKHQIVKSSLQKFKLFNIVFFVQISIKPLVNSTGLNNMYLIIFEHFDLNNFIEKGGLKSEQSDILLSQNIELEQELYLVKEQLQLLLIELERKSEEILSQNEEFLIALNQLKKVNIELEKKQRLLDDSKSNLLTIINSSLQAFILIDKNYRVLRYNNKATDIIVSLFDKEIQQNQLYSELLSPNLLEVFQEEINNVLAGNASSNEISLMDQNNIRRYFSISYTPILGESKIVESIVIGLADISIRKQALNDLAIVEGLLYSIKNIVPVGIASIDENGIIADVNQKLCSMLGYHKTELIQKHFKNLIPEEFQNEYLRIFHNFIIDGKTTKMKFNLQKKDGRLMEIYEEAVLLTLPSGEKRKVSSISVL